MKPPSYHITSYHIQLSYNIRIYPVIDETTIQYRSALTSTFLPSFHFLPPLHFNLPIPTSHQPSYPHFPPPTHTSLHFRRRGCIGQWRCDHTNVGPQWTSIFRGEINESNERNKELSERLSFAILPFPSPPCLPTTNNVIHMVNRIFTFHNSLDNDNRQMSAFYTSLFWVC